LPGFDQAGIENINLSRKLVFTTLFAVGLVCLSCLIVFAPRQYPAATPADKCVAPPFTLFQKPRSITFIHTQCIVSSDPYEQVRNWYHTEPLGLMSRLPGFPMWRMGPFGFSIYSTLDLPTPFQFEEFTQSTGIKIIVITGTSYSFSW
jgi:hypothetical protein